MTTPKRLQRLAACLAGLSSLVAPLLAQDADYTSTGLVVSAEAPGLVFGNALGQVFFRNNTHTARVTSTDPRLTGRRRVLVDGAYNADGTARLWGVCYQEVGTWSDTTFTPSGGFWEIRYTGTMGLDLSLQARLIGTGVGGAVEGLRFTETMTRGPSAAPVDPAQPYQYTGHIASGPTEIRQMVDAFDGPLGSAWSIDGTGQGQVKSVNGALVVSARWPGIVTREYGDAWYWGDRRFIGTIANGRTREWRVDLLGMTEGSTNAAGLIVAESGRQSFYVVYKGANFLQLGKYHDGGMSVFFHDTVGIESTNITLSLVMSRSNPSLLLTARVLDKTHPDTVLYQHTAVDSSQSDRMLTRAGLLAASGMSLTVKNDSVEAPLWSIDTVGLVAWQCTDGAQPALEVTFDNLETREYETPLLAIEPSVTLLVPSAFDLEQAPGVNGPWTPVVEPALNGIDRISVPARAGSSMFRAVAKP